MRTIYRAWLPAALLWATATAQTITPTNFTKSDSELENNDSVDLRISDGDEAIPLSPVLALTESAQNDIPSNGLSGTAFIASPSDELRMQSDQIVLISCDPYSGFIDAAGVFTAATAKSPSAILLYTQNADYCHLTGYSGSYSWIYSMKSRNDTGALLNEVFSSGNGGQVYARIGTAGSLQTISPSNGASAHGNDQGTDQGNPLGPSPTTAVAMIILYSITGIITALFLVIIITGAMRAHRHPERYGPRPGVGRPRQSRARGLARAMLETLPIVKFGEREEPKPADLELQNNSSTTDTTTERAAEGQAEETIVQPKDGTREVANEENQPARSENHTEQARQSVEGGGIAAAITDTNDAASNDPDHIGCSICTEDFETGQDQRVLPCNHRFHPECVDPWLLNVSGTCPLCRIDLQPDGEQQRDEDGNPTVLHEGVFEPPPLGPQETAGERQRMGARRSIMLGIMGIGRPDRTTREERVLALRQLRGQELARRSREAQAEVQETPEEQRRMRVRLRSVLGMRTRRTGQAGEGEAGGDTSGSG